MPTEFCNGLHLDRHLPLVLPGAAPTGFTVHPLFHEIHARPFPVVDSALRVVHLVFLRGEDANIHAEEARLLAELWTQLGLEGEPGPSRQLEIPLGNSGLPLKLRVERHTEFTTYSFWAEGEFGVPFGEFPWPGVPHEWLSAVPGQLVGAAQLALHECELGIDREEVRHYFDGQRLVASTVVEESATVWTSYQLHEDGYNRFLIHNHDLQVCRAGRLVQRLLEMETYRSLAMLGLPLARALWPRLTYLEKELVSVFDALNTRQDMNLTAQQDLLRQLTRLADEIEHLRADSSYRFAATRAYGTLVEELLNQLREEQISGLQTLREFLDRRLPASLRTCETAAQRIESLSERVDRAGDLLRTRINLTLERQNQDLLASMDKRAGM